MATAMFNEKTTADEVASYFKARNVLMEGKTYMVTGANCGLGLETARVIAANGGIVIALSRSAQNGENAVAKIKEKHPNAQVTSMVIDLSSLKSIRACAEAFIQEGKPLHALINNAGIMACPKSLTEDGFESQIGTMHYVTVVWGLNDSTLRLQGVHNVLNKVSHPLLCRRQPLGPFPPNRTIASHSCQDR
jgi:NAD(P)-dependent dehydrogenase (short-subunit alcohol dehydrogenase family)